jgi:rubrerythrin
MLKLKTGYVNKVLRAQSAQELFPFLQKAIELEHATIPPYLTALFSLKPGKEPEIKQIIHEVVIEEMMHMTLVANIMNAIGGKPCIDKPDFVPSYPTPLPMGIGKGLIVHLEAYSKDVVEKTFMEIEEPEDPIAVRAEKARAKVPFHTIGEFYKAIQKKIDKLMPEEMPGDPKLQVTSPFFPPYLLFPILKKKEALRAIEIIIEQGEGTSTSPVDEYGEIAHYYLFKQLSVGRRLVKDDHAPYGYSFTGPEIPFYPENVYPLFPDTKAQMLAAGTEARYRVDEFNASYTSLLRGLQKTFNGDPEHLPHTMGLMYDIKLSGEKLCAAPFPGKEGFTIGPSFEYVPSGNGMVYTD